jgi:hypothetical protein
MSNEDESDPDERPWTIAERIEALEILAGDLAAEMSRSPPSMYRDQQRRLERLVAEIERLQKEADRR